MKNYIILLFLLILVPCLCRTEQPIQTFQESISLNEGPNEVGYLYIGDHGSSISEATWLYVKQALEYYKAHPPIFIILELNTPGGEVFAAQKISDALTEMDIQFRIPIVTFINNWAISAGAMLAYSSRFITVVKGGIMGAAEPVYAGEGGKLESASEKINSAIRADFASRADFFGRNPLLAEAMVDKDIILVIREGKIIRLDNESQIRFTDPNPDRVISLKGKLLTLNAEEMVEFGVANLLLQPMHMEQITPEEKRMGTWPGKKMLLFHAPFFSSIPEVTVRAYQMDWKTQLFVFLASPMISSFLLMGLIVGAYVEMNQPGLSFPGFIAGISLFLIVLSSFSLQISNWLEVVFLLVGISIILVDLFFLPTFGVLGAIGVFLFLVGLAGMFLPSLNDIHFDYDSQSLNLAGQFFFKRLAWFCGILILSFAVILFLGRFILPSFSSWNALILKGHEQEALKGFIAGDSPSSLPQPGNKGLVLTMLHPTGKVVINDQIFDAISAGDFLEVNEPIIVTKLEGNVIFVNREEKMS